jgi:hypothetical protein
VVTLDAAALNNELVHVTFSGETAAGGIPGAAVLERRRR